MPQNLGANYMFGQNSGTNYEAYRKNRWIVTIDGFDTELAAQDCDLPGWSHQQISVRHMNDEVKIAGMPTFKNINISLLDFVQPNIFNQIYNWALLAYDPNTHKMGYASKYKKQGTIHQFDTEMNNERIWLCKGLWVTHSPGSRESLTYDDHGLVKLSLELSCDYAVIQGATGAASGAASAGGLL